jgi:hypothetical protein
VAGPDDIALHLTVRQLATLLRMHELRSEAFDNRNGIHSEELQALQAFELVRPAVHPKGCWKISPKGRLVAMMYLGQARTTVRIDITSADEVEYWSTELGVDEPTLRSAVEAAGEYVENVRQYLAHLQRVGPAKDGN